MPKAPSGEFVTVRVRRAWTALRPDGRTALVLDTPEMGPIAFEIDERRIEILRQKLAEAEEALSLKPGTA